MTMIRSNSRLTKSDRSVSTQLELSSGRDSDATSNDKLASLKRPLGHPHTNNVVRAFVRPVGSDLLDELMLRLLDNNCKGFDVQRARTRNI